MLGSGSTKTLLGTHIRLTKIVDEPLTVEATTPWRTKQEVGGVAAGAPGTEVIYLRKFSVGAMPLRTSMVSAYIRWRRQGIGRKIAVVGKRCSPPARHRRFNRPLGRVAHGLGSDGADGFDRVNSFGSICDHFSVFIEKIEVATRKGTSDAISYIQVTKGYGDGDIAFRTGNSIERPFHSGIGVEEGTNRAFGFPAHFLLHDGYVGKAHYHGKNHEKKNGGEKKGGAPPHGGQAFFGFWHSFYFIY